MQEMDADELCNWLLEQDAEIVLSWLYEILEGTRPLAEDFNWMGFGEVTVFLADHKQGKVGLPPDRDWAYIAVLVHEYIISEAKARGRFVNQYFAPDAKEHARFSFEERLMCLRAKWIQRLGSVSGDALLDGEHLLTWFFKPLHFSPEEALQRRARRNELSRGERWELNRMRRKLAIIRPLVEQQLIAPSPELSRWFSVWQWERDF